MSSIFKTTKLTKSNSPFILPQNLQPIDFLEFDGLDGKKTLRQELDSSFTDAFIVLKNGEIIFEEYQNDMKPESLHLMNSVSKSFVGMLIGILVEEKKLSPVDKITKYIPELKNSPFINTTIQHALDMTAAVSFGEDYDDSNSEFWHEAAVVGWRPELVKTNSPKNILDFMCNLTSSSQEDDEKFNYRTVLTNVLALTAQRACGEKFQDLLQKHIWDKLHTEHEAHIVADETDFPYMGAGMNASARDLAKFGLMLMNNGTLNNERVVPESWIKETLNQDQSCKDKFLKGDYAARLPGFHYRNQTWVGDETTLICLGIYGQAIFINQKNSLVIVKLSSHPAPDDPIILGNSFLGINAISENI
jgi:CubicO group peptidase (beta-lactamase class C family)